MMPTSETQEVVNASVPTTGDQGQVASKMIYLHVTKPHSLTQMAICSKKPAKAWKGEGLTQYSLVRAGDLLQGWEAPVG